MQYAQPELPYSFGLLTQRPAKLLKGSVISFQNKFAREYTFASVPVLRNVLNPTVLHQEGQNGRYHPSYRRNGADPVLVLWPFPSPHLYLSEYKNIPSWNVS